MTLGQRSFCWREAMRGTDHNVSCYWPDLAVKQPLKLVPLLDWHRDLGFVSGVNKDHRSSLIKLSRMGKKKDGEGRLPLHTSISARIEERLYPSKRCARLTVIVEKAITLPHCASELGYCFKEGPGGGVGYRAAQRQTSRRWPMRMWAVPRKIYRCTAFLISQRSH